MTPYRYAIRCGHSWVATCRYDRLSGRLILPVVFSPSVNKATLYKSKGNAKAFITKAAGSKEIQGANIVPLYLSTRPPETSEMLKDV